MASKLIPRVLAAALLLLLLQRLTYHAAYLANDPFSLVTFSDGRLYERAAQDLTDHAPWGRRPFYLQGIYAYVLAVPMTWWPGPAMGLLLQLAIVASGLLLFHRAMQRMYGHPVGALCTVLLLVYPGLSFYENKFLTAGLAEASLCFMLAAVAWMAREARSRATIALGAATGFAVLARGNMLLALPAVVVAVVILGRLHHGAARRSLLAFAGGMLLLLAPMAVRNAVVTGTPTIFPAHGGGTSFYIGNNAEAKGLWNDARGLVSGDVGQERAELVDALGIGDGDEAAQASAIGRALYARAAHEIVEDPSRWLRLEAKKVWLLVGNDELSQDYDARGEAELVGHVREYGLPFPWIFGLGLVGALALWRERAPGGSMPTQDIGLCGESACRRAWLWVLGGMALAVAGANVLFFTSAQHRAPLAVVAAALAGPGLLLVAASFRDAHLAWWRRAGPLLVVVALVVQGYWPRIAARSTPSAAHYHNLALVQLETGEPRAAVATLTRALVLNPEHPVIRIERASVQRRLGMIDAAAVDLGVLRAQRGLPAWVVARLESEQRRVDALRGLRRGR